MAVAPSVPAAFSAGFRVAPITAIIVSIGDVGAAPGPLESAIGRIPDVGLGGAVRPPASVLVAPVRASHAVVKPAVEVAWPPADRFDAPASPPGEPVRPDRGAPDPGVSVTRTRRALTRQAPNRLEALVGEAARERRSHPAADAPDPQPLFRTLLRWTSAGRAYVAERWKAVIEGLQPRGPLRAHLGRPVIPIGVPEVDVPD